MDFKRKRYVYMRNHCFYQCRRKIRRHAVEPNIITDAGCVSLQAVATGWMAAAGSLPKEKKTMENACVAALTIASGESAGKPSGCDGCSFPADQKAFTATDKAFNLKAQANCKTQPNTPNGIWQTTSDPSGCGAPLGATIQAQAKATFGYMNKTINSADRECGCWANWRTTTNPNYSAEKITAPNNDCGTSEEPTPCFCTAVWTGGKDYYEQKASDYFGSDWSSLFKATCNNAKLK